MAKPVLAPCLRLGGAACRMRLQPWGWYLKAAEAVFVVGHLNLALLRGWGKGRCWRCKLGERERGASKGGSAGGQAKLGIMLETGQGCQKDKAAAGDWCWAAAEGSNTVA